MQDQISITKPGARRAAITPMLIAITFLLIFIPGGCRDSWMSNHRARLAREQEAIARSPLHARCSLCLKPATHAREYEHEKLHDVATYYFCDDHWPAPERAPYLAHGQRTTDLAPTLRGDQIASFVGSGFTGLALLTFLSSRKPGARRAAFTLAAIAFAGVVACWAMARVAGAGIGS
jgi:hypothetical protein